MKSERYPNEKVKSVTVISKALSGEGRMLSQSKLMMFKWKLLIVVHVHSDSDVNGCDCHSLYTFRNGYVVVWSG